MIPTPLVFQPCLRALAKEIIICLARNVWPESMLKKRHNGDIEW